jgi:hypothetical protein
MNHNDGHLTVSDLLEQGVMHVLGGTWDTSTDVIDVEDSDRFRLILDKAARNSGPSGLQQATINAVRTALACGMGLKVEVEFFALLNDTSKLIMGGLNVASSHEFIITGDDHETALMDHRFFSLTPNPSALRTSSWRSRPTWARSSPTCTRKRLAARRSPCM